MVELIPQPFGRLASRMFRELRERDAIFDLPRRRFFLGAPDLDLSVRFHGKRAGSALGPAAGPQSQLAQNIVLSWLGGARIVELKTVQILDRLQIPRPCIDMHNVGYNVEWSQELTLEQSLEEYVKAAMLVHMLARSGEIEMHPDPGDVLYDMSVGYDLAGIRSERVQAFVHGMMDCGAVVDRLRGELPPELSRWAELDFPRRLSDTLTLSTFHGCPPDEIERIIEFLQDGPGLHCVVKLNPTLLGPDELRHVLRDRLGYRDLRTPDEAFAQDTRWEQAVEFVERLRVRAGRLGLGFGIKLTNTLIVENHRDFFGSDQKQMYLSGPPLHVLAVQLVDRFRRHFGDAVPVSFSAGIDRHNAADAVALGLVPVTVCSDLLKTGGYGRLAGYFQAIASRMAESGARDVDELVLLGHGQAATALADVAPDRGDLGRLLADGGAVRRAAGGALFDAWLGAARVRNAAAYAARVLDDPRYRREQNTAVPKKIGSRLALFDCVTCDKCIPVCPNDANFAFEMAVGSIPRRTLRRSGDGWSVSDGPPLELVRKHQIGNFADFCNECGNCDVFCPEDGGPYVVKPRFFGSLASFERFADRDGFHLERLAAGFVVHGRLDGVERRLGCQPDGRLRFAGEGFEVCFDPRDVAGTAEGRASGDVDLTHAYLMQALGEALLVPGVVGYI